MNFRVASLFSLLEFRLYCSISTLQSIQIKFILHANVYCLHFVLILSSGDIFLNIFSKKILILDMHSEGMPAFLIQSKFV